MKQRYPSALITSIIAAQSATFAAEPAITPAEPAKPIRQAGSTVLTTSQGRPNIIVFLSDDHGWRDSGCYGNTDVRTPSLDRLATEGLRFTQAFAATPLCSPSRCVIETGLMPHRNGAHKFEMPIRPGVQTMPVYFKNLGYLTAELGKFHHAPKKAFPYDVINANEHSAPEFIGKHNGKQPLFLMVCANDPHTPWAENKTYVPEKLGLPPNFVDTPRTHQDRANYYTDVENMDALLGKVLKAIDDKKMRDNTLFVYTTDQGANWPFAKWCVYDAGLRVPFIVRWPGKTATNTTTAAMVSLCDLLPTCLEVAGGTPPKTLDGRSLTALLSGKTNQFRDVIFGTHTGNENGGPGIANHCPARTVITPKYQYILNLSPETPFTTHITGCPPGDIHHLPFWLTWVEKAKTDTFAKQIVTAYQHRPREELYDLAADPYEMKNLAADPRHAETRRELRTQLRDWCRQQGDTEPLRFLNP